MKKLKRISDTEKHLGALIAHIIALIARSKRSHYKNLYKNEIFFEEVYFMKEYFEKIKFYKTSEQYIYTRW